ncbi:hypothetical protein H6F39_11165 [Anabaena sp. FACHB-1250]|nr:hypothetical protein [Anabaena sp. FACHB-1250]
MIIHCLNCLIYEDSEDLSRLALKIVVMTREQGTGNREQGTGNREQGRGFGQLYFSLLMSVFFRSLTYAQVRE